VVNEPNRDEVWLVNLDPTLGSEIQKTRPCLVVSPDEMNHRLFTIIVAPMTSVVRAYPTRVTVAFQGRRGQVALEQIRAVDRARLVRRLGTLPRTMAAEVARTLVEIFTRQ
jgi:mRNA interferase MazF